MVFNLPSVGLFHSLHVSFLVIALVFTFLFDGSNGSDTEKALKCVSASFSNGSVVSSLENITEYMEAGELSPVIRFLGICPGQPASVGIIMEMRAQFSVIFTTITGEEKCVTVSLCAKPGDPELQGIPRNTTNLTVSASRPARREVENKSKKKLDHRNASLHHQKIFSEIPLNRCSNTSRTLSLVIDVQTQEANASVLEPWLLEFTWKRTPEHYEVGEIGWSSVGVHAGTLSGTYSLTDVSLFLYLHDQRGLELINPNLVGRPFVVHAEAQNLFRVRAGDFYQCESEHHLLLTSPQSALTAFRTSLTASNEPYAADNLSRSVSNHGIRVILSTRNLRLQAFSDYNDEEFTGSGVICKEDIHEDHTVTLAFGATVCVVVAISMVGLMITRLREKDRDLQAIDASILKTKQQIILGRPVNRSTVPTGRPEDCCPPPPYRECPV
uniref:Uncharacterized protein n=1 Tax=Schistocephalus solidus TaxID=70667 RepID=A0A0X3NVG7_SCHSO